MIPTPAEAAAHVATSDERVDHAIAHIRATLLTRYHWQSSLTIELPGLYPHEQQHVLRAFRDRGWFVSFAVESWPERVSTHATLKPLTKS